jgi:hypothetical protein
MMFEPDVCCFKSVSCDLTGYIGASKKPLIGTALRAGSGGNKPPKKPRRGGDDDNSDNGGFGRYVLGDYVLTWKGKALLAFAAASMFLGVNKSHDVAQGLKEFGENVVTVAKQYPTNQSFNGYRP